MGFPRIIVSSSGSDSSTSGAGPGDGTTAGSAVTGTQARCRNAAGQTCIFFEETVEPNLSAILSNGTHAICVSVSTAGAKNFGRIISVKDTKQSQTGDMLLASAVVSNIPSTAGMSAGDGVRVSGAAGGPSDLYSTILTVDTANQITLNDAAGTLVTGANVFCFRNIKVPTGEGFTFTGVQSWAIGGKRLTLNGSISKRLWDNNSANGDAQPGWSIYVESSAWTDTSAAAMVLRRAGSANVGMINLKTAPNLAVAPKITFSHNGIGVQLNGGFWIFDGFQLESSNGGASTMGVYINSSSNVIRNVKAADATNEFNEPLHWEAGSMNLVENCEFGYGQAANIRVSNTAATCSGTIRRCRSHHSGTHGLEFLASVSTQQLTVEDSLFFANTSIGIKLAPSNTTTTTGNYAPALSVRRCTVDGNGGAGIDINVNVNAYWLYYNLLICDNSITSNTGVGLNFSNGSVTADILDAAGVRIVNNNIYGNSAQFGSIIPTVITNTQNVAPAYTNSAGDNWITTATGNWDYTNIAFGSTPCTPRLGAGKLISGSSLILIED